MNAMEFLSKIHVDGKPVPGVLQIQMDAGQTTIVYDKPRTGREPTRRVITVETEAVTIG